jgi:hypothetical protein
MKGGHCDVERFREGALIDLPFFVILLNKIKEILIRVHF